MQFLPVGRHAARLFLFYIPSLDLLAAAETLMRDQRADYAPFRTSSDDGGEVLWFVNEGGLQMYPAGFQGVT